MPLPVFQTTSDLRLYFSKKSWFSLTALYHGKACKISDSKHNFLLFYIIVSNKIPVNIKIAE